MNYKEYSFTISPLLPGKEVLIAELSELDFESFVEETDGLKAYIQAEGPSAEEISSLMAFKIEGTTIDFEIIEVERENWNAKWESDFNPIFVGDDIVVRAPFHESTSATYDLVIQPKMSFGTGHHDTTWLMLERMLSMGIEGKSVLDMGSGTGVLAILAAKLGAKAVDAIDIDDWSKENCEENALLNQCTTINSEIGDAALLPGRSFDIVLANINRNVLVTDMPTYSSVLKQDGLLQLSGFFPSDQKILVKAAEESGLTFVKGKERNGWMTLGFVKK